MRPSVYVAKIDLGEGEIGDWELVWFDGTDWRAPDPETGVLEIVYVAKVQQPLFMFPPR